MVVSRVIVFTEELILIYGEPALKSVVSKTSGLFCKSFIKECSLKDKWSLVLRSFIKDCSLEDKQSLELVFHQRM